MVIDYFLTWKYSMIQHSPACFISLWFLLFYHFCMFSILHQPLSSINQLESSCLTFSHGAPFFIYAYCILFISMTQWFPNSSWVHSVLFFLFHGLVIFRVHISTGIINFCGIRNSWSNSKTGHLPSAENDTTTELNTSSDIWESSLIFSFLSPIYTMPSPIFNP